MAEGGNRRRSGPQPVGNGPDSLGQGAKALPEPPAVSWIKLKPEDHLPTLTSPFSEASEQYRMLAVHLDRSMQSREPSSKVIAFSSAMPNEGKTTTSLNTAIVAAQQRGRRVALVECDLRSPSIKKLLANPPVTGLTEVLEGSRTIEDVLLETQKPPGLSLVLAGRPSHTPVDLLGSTAMVEVIQWLRDHFELIIMDTPPALHFADASQLGALVDEFLLVVRSGRTSRESLVKTHRLLAPFGVGGVVLNDVRHGRQEGYSYVYRKYGTDQNGGT